MQQALGEPPRLPRKKTQPWSPRSPSLGGQRHLLWLRAKMYTDIPPTPPPGSCWEKPSSSLLVRTKGQTALLFVFLLRFYLKGRKREAGRKSPSSTDLSPRYLHQLGLGQAEIWSLAFHLGPPFVWQELQYLSLCLLPHTARTKRQLEFQRDSDPDTMTWDGHAPGSAFTTTSSISPTPVFGCRD